MIVEQWRTGISNKSPAGSHGTSRRTKLTYLYLILDSVHPERGLIPRMAGGAGGQGF